MSRKSQLLLARILIVISCIMMVGGFLYNYKVNGTIIDPVKDTVPLDDDRTVSITTVDDEENIVIPEDAEEEDIVVEDKPTKEENEKKPEKEDNDSKTTGDTDKKPSGNTGGSTSGGNSSSKPSGGGSKTPAPSTKPVEPTPQTPQTPVYPTIDETNNNLRNNLQNTYGITIKYGSETNGYSVGGLTTTSISNSYTIQTALNNLSAGLALYPNGFFQEIKNGGIPLTLYLIKNYSQNGVTGATDSNIHRATISIAIDYPFSETFHHEVYHYMDRYIEKRGATYSNWALYNPGGFQYVNATVNTGYSYSVTGNAASYFVNNYAQHSESEDRASTFEYMMAGSRASCFAPGQPIWNKAQHMSEIVDVVFNTVYPNVTEYWERFLV